MKFLRNYRDFLDITNESECPFQNSLIHKTDNGCCLIIHNNIYYHVFKKIRNSLDCELQPVAKIFEKGDVSYAISPYFEDPQYVRLISTIGIDCSYVTSFFNNHGSVLLFLQRHIYEYFVTILPILNDYPPPIFSFSTQQVTMNAISENYLESLNVIGNNRLRRQVEEANLTPFMIYLNNLKLEELNHIHPLGIFDVAATSERKIIYLRPTLIIPIFDDFVRFYRAIIFEIIYEYAKSDECKKAYENNPRKLKVKTLCHAEYFTTKRQTPPEFKCVAATAEACPHINDNIGPNGKVPLIQRDTLCTFLIQKYVDDYPDYNQINSILDFRCKFQDLDNKDDKVDAKVKIFAFYNIFNKTSGMHRMCIPDRYLSVNWFKWAISLIQIH